ncbi:MAG: hypothetical protein Q9190_006005, partial [Brigantiaea leucoxantha]
MGGLVAAETLLSIVSDDPIPSSKPDPSTSPLLSSPSTSSLPNAFMFPFIQGILAFDTPYLGISPSLIAHASESHYRSASSAYSSLSELATTFGYGASSSPSPRPAPTIPQLALPAAPEHAKDSLAASMTATDTDAAATPTWQRWGKYAMFAGAAGAVAAGGAAAYFKKDKISEGWNWVGSHLEFVGCLMRGEELKTRLERVVKLNRERGIGFTDMVTVLGRGAGAKAGLGTTTTTTTTQLAGGFVEINHGGGGGGGGGEVAKREMRTFCNLPKSERNRGYFRGEVNDKAGDETVAHM